MASHEFRILNVFAIEGDRLSGNPVCVFEDGRGIDDAAMQGLALQFNLSETTFILPSERATAKVRIFTPMFEMPFAGHPTLGTAHVVRALKGSSDASGPTDKLTLEMKAGLIPVEAEADRWTLRANAPTYRAPAATTAELASMLSLDPNDVLPGAQWVNTGSDQLVIPLRTPDAVERSRPVGDLLKRYGRVNDDRYLAYVFAEAGEGDVRARFFFPRGASVVEDPATGSACANLGGWYLAQRRELPLARRVRQGDAVKRPSELWLSVDRDENVLVSGRVVELGRGVVTL